MHRRHRHDERHGRLVFGIFATLFEFERDPILERTMAGPPPPARAGAPAAVQG